MKTMLQRLGRGALVLSMTWFTAAVCHAVPTNRSTASMTLLLEIVLVATLADWYLSLATCAAASLAFSWYFVESSGSFSVTTVEGVVTMLTMVIASVAVSHIAVRSRQRATEADRRRAEMGRLQEFGSALLTAYTVAEAAEKAVLNVVYLFGLQGASIRLRDLESEFRFWDKAATPKGAERAATPKGDERAATAGSDGRSPTEARSAIEIEHGSEFFLYGTQPSAEVRSALGRVMNLAIDRARVNEERTQNEAAKRGERLQNTVLNALAHNFKTPLTSIKAASSSLLRSDDVATAQGREMIAVIDEEADRLGQLIDESLDLARIESHQANPTRERCSIDSIVEAVAERAARYLRGRDLVISVPADIPAVAGDRFLFEQMVMQVVDNAWKYSRPGARIEISAVSELDRVVLTIRNEGSAIPDDEKDKIFGRFYRGAVNRSQVEGTGLGLAIAKAIAEAHRGALWLDSEPEGPAFRFSLPVEANGE